MNIEVNFPSGKKQLVEVQSVVAKPMPQGIRTAQPPRQRRPKACRYIGSAIQVSVGCAGPNLKSLWECDLHGPCAPLALVQFSPDVTICSRCEDWAPADEPGFVRLGLTYATALKKWIVAGRPVRLQKQVDSLYATCQLCPFLSRSKHGEYCGKCGCPVNHSIDKPSKNKLAMATEECPEGRW